VSAIRYDVAIYSPAASFTYRTGAAATGGAERQMALLARYLTRRGVRVCHIIEHADGLLPSGQGVDLIIQEASGGLRTRGVVQRSWSGRERVRRVMDALRRADARVYVQRAAGLPTLLVGAFARLHGRDFIYSSASPLELVNRAPLARVEAVGFRLGLPLATAIVVQTHEQAIMAPRGRKVFRIPSICEPQPRIDTKREIFLWVGRPARYKNPEAFIRLAHDVSEASFVMVGVDAASGQRFLGGRVGDAAIPSNLRLLPPLPDECLRALYRRAIAVVNTSESEGFPNTLLEGWSHGTLALSLHVDPDGVITREGLGVVAGGSAAGLAQAARRMLYEGGAVVNQRERAIRYVATHHAPEDVAARWDGMIRTLPSFKRRPPTRPVNAGDAGP
jgi:glycosyltransferase involved in cell wall biosynthesis